jgi:hypothetical protein
MTTRFFEGRRDDVHASGEAGIIPTHELARCHLTGINDIPRGCLRAMHDDLKLLFPVELQM